MSSRPVLDQSDAVSDFVATLLDEPGLRGHSAIGFADHEGRLVAGAVYHNWKPETGVIEISSASIHRRWTTRENIRTIFNYPFAIGCQMAVARISETNPAPLRIWQALGADTYRIPRLRGRNEAEVIATLTAEQWQESKFHG